MVKYATTNGMRTITEIEEFVMLVGVQDDVFLEHMKVRKGDTGNG